MYETRSYNETHLGAAESGFNWEHGVWKGVSLATAFKLGLGMSSKCSGSLKNPSRDTEDIEKESNERHKVALT